MNKSELVHLVARTTKVRTDVVEEVLDTAIAMMVRSISDEESVTLRGFGRFQPRARPAVRLKHPQTGAPLDVDIRRTVVFLPAPLLKERLNGPPF